MNEELPLWRSILFVPANVDRFIDGAAGRGADAYILDLEDSVPAAEKSSARAGLQDAVRRLSIVANGQPLAGHGQLGL